MSTYKWTVHPDTDRWELAEWRDDHFGQHHCGVIFPDGKIFDPWDSSKPIRVSISDREAATLNFMQDMLRLSAEERLKHG